MSCKQMVKFITKIIHIIKGNIRRLFGYDSNMEELVKTRKSICCKCNNKIHIFFIGNICKRCGCPIKSKVLVEDEQCPEGKW